MPACVRECGMRRPFACALAVLLAVLAASVRDARAQPTAPPSLVALDIELTGDTGGPAFDAEHAARLAKESELLREQLRLSGLYRMIDPAAARPLIDRLKGQQRYLHDCNACDLDVGRALGADETLVAWVDRVSGLILSLTYEIHDVRSGQILKRKSFDFRGDNDAAWTHAIRYMVRDMAG